MDWSSLVEAFSKESKLWETFYDAISHSNSKQTNNAPQLHNANATNESLTSSPRERENKNGAGADGQGEQKVQKIEEFHINSLVFDAKASSNGGGGGGGGGGGRTNHNGTAAAATTTKFGAAAPNSTMPPATIQFVNVHQYLHDVRHYMTRALSGQMVEMVVPHNEPANSSSCTCRVQHQSVQTDTTDMEIETEAMAVVPQRIPSNDASVADDIGTVCATFSDTVTAVGSVLNTANSGANTNSNNVADTATIITSLLKVNASVSPPVNVDVASPVDVASASSLGASTKANATTTTKKERTIASKHVKTSTTRVAGSVVDDHMDNKTMRETRAHGHHYVQENRAVNPKTRHSEARKEVTVTKKMPIKLAKTKQRRPLHEPRNPKVVVASSVSTVVPSSTVQPRRTTKRKDGVLRQSFAARKLATPMVTNRRPTKTTSRITSKVSKTSNTLKSTKTSKTSKTSKTLKSAKAMHTDATKGNPTITVRGSWGRLLSTALGLSDTQHANNAILNENEQTSNDSFDSKTNISKKVSPKKFIQTHSNSTTTNNKVKQSLSSMQQPSRSNIRELYPRESIVMLHLLALKVVQTSKTLPLVQRIIDGLAGFLLGKHVLSISKTSNKISRAKSGKKSGTTSGKTSTEKSTTIKTTKHGKKNMVKRKTTKTKTPLDMFQKNLHKIESIFLQFSVDIDGSPSKALEKNNRSGCCPHWCDVGIAMKTLPLKVKSKKKESKSKIKIVLATPLLMPIRSSGKCLIPPLEKCVFDVAIDSDENRLGSEGRVVRLFLTAAIVEQVKLQLVDYGTMYQSERDKTATHQPIVETGNEADQTLEDDRVEITQSKRIKKLPVKRRVGRYM